MFILLHRRYAVLFGAYIIRLSTFHQRIRPDCRLILDHGGAKICGSTGRLAESSCLPATEDIRGSSHRLPEIHKSASAGRRLPK